MLFEHNGATLYYTEIGAGIPIVMLHGFLCDHRLMSGCMEPIFAEEKQYRRIYIDLPGMGKSAAPMAYASADGMLHILLSFLRERLAVPFLLAGESYGGYLARGILDAIPEQVLGILLLCPVALPERSARMVPSKTVLSRDDKFLETLSTQTRQDFCLYAVHATPECYARYESDIACGAAIADKEFLAQLSANYAFSFDVDARLALKPYEKPTLLLTGRQDSCVGYRDQWRLLEAFPRATFAVLDSAGHNLQIEQPAVLESLSRDWLKRVAHCAK